ncbi:MAG: hypothetical protein OXG08_11605 [Gammaproteobacteria bacterium]|nr:hypothetical protein [Gammaproteobacteria bacterium]
MQTRTILATQIDEYRHAMGKPLVYRVHRLILGGSLGDNKTKPLAWAVAIPIDGVMHSLVSVRNNRREWQDLNRLAQELRKLGFVEYEVRNNLSEDA